MRTLFVIGTRPEIIKLASTIANALDEGDDIAILHTGQHFLPVMTTQVWEELLKLLGIMQSAISFIHKEMFRNENFQSHEDRNREIWQRLEYAMKKFEPDIVVALGDTFSVTMTAIYCHTRRIRFVHIEGGFRSGLDYQIEEGNRRLADVVADLNLCPTSREASILCREEVPGHRAVVGCGNTDLIYRFKRLPKYRPPNKPDILFTVHRKENIGHPIAQQNILQLLVALGEKKVLYPLHPYTRDRLEKLDLLDDILSLSHVTVTKPLSFLNLLTVIENCEAVITDSGGLQLEPAYFKVPVISLREATEYRYCETYGSLVLRDLRVKTDWFEVNDLLDDQWPKDTNWQSIHWHYGIGAVGARTMAAIRYHWENYWKGNPK